MGNVAAQRELTVNACPIIAAVLEGTNAVEVVRRTPLYADLRRSMRDDDPEALVGRAVVERASRVTLGAYGTEARMVLIARGDLAGLVEEVAAQLRSHGHPVTPAERLGFSLFYVSDEMVVAQTAADTVVVAYPEHIDEVLRAAAGRAPATPLPEPMRRLRDRPPFSASSMHMVFRALEGGGGSSDPLGTTIAEAGWAGVAGRLEGTDLVAIGRVAAPRRAAQLASELEQMARQTSERDVRSAALAAAIRAAAVRTDGRWVEVELRFPPEELEHFMALVDPLDR